MNYDLELERVISEINKIKAKKVLIQFPDGLKPKAAEIVKEIRKKTNADIMIWLGSCWGACDIPLEAKDSIDLLIQFGHSSFGFENVIKKINNLI